MQRQNMRRSVSGGFHLAAEPGIGANALQSLSAPLWPRKLSGTLNAHLLSLPHRPPDAAHSLTCFLECFMNKCMLHTLNYRQAHASVGARVLGLNCVRGDRRLQATGQ